MKKIITAINNPKLNEELRKEKKFEIIGKDIQYKEAIFEILEKNNNIDLIILSEKILGEIKLEKVIEKIKSINKKIKIIFILEKENIELEKILIKNNIIDFYYNNKINLNELIKIINKKEINMEEEIIRLKKIIEEKNISYNKIKKDNIEENKKTKKSSNNLKEKYIKKMRNKVEMIIKTDKKNDNFRNMSTKIITFSGNNKGGKTTLSLIISQYLCEKNYKVLIIDGDLEKKDLSIILKNKWKNNKKKNNNLKKNYLNKRKTKNLKSIKLKKKINNSFRYLINKKNTIYYYKIKKIINIFTNKINKNLYFFHGLDYLFKNKIIKRNKILEKLIFTLLEIIKQNYNFIIIDLSKSNLKIINNVILKNSSINFLLIEANPLGINEIQNILNMYIKQWKINKNNVHIVSNRKKINSINKKLISNCIPIKNKIFEIKENKIYYNIINNYFINKKLFKNIKIKREISKIIHTAIKNKKL